MNFKLYVYIRNVLQVGIQQLINALFTCKSPHVSKLSNTCTYVIAVLHKLSPQQLNNDYGYLTLLYR